MASYMATMIRLLSKRPQITKTNAQWWPGDTEVYHRRKTFIDERSQERLHAAFTVLRLIIAQYIGTKAEEKGRAKRDNAGWAKAVQPSALQYMTDGEVQGAFTTEEETFCNPSDQSQQILGDIFYAHWRSRELDDVELPLNTELKHMQRVLEPPSHSEAKTRAIIQMMSEGGLGVLSAHSITVDMLNAIAEVGHAEDLSPRCLVSSWSQGTRTKYRLDAHSAGRSLQLEELPGTNGQHFDFVCQSLRATSVVDAAWLIDSLFDPRFAHIAHPVNIDAISSVLTALASYGYDTYRAATGPSTAGMENDTDTDWAGSRYVTDSRPTLLVTKPEMVLYWVDRLVQWHYRQDDGTLAPVFNGMAFLHTSQINTMEQLEELPATTGREFMTKTMVVTTPVFWMSQALTRSFFPAGRQHIIAALRIHWL